MSRSFSFKGAFRVMNVTAFSRLMNGRRAKYGCDVSSSTGMAERMECFWMRTESAEKISSFKTIGLSE